MAYRLRYCRNALPTDPGNLYPDNGPSLRGCNNCSRLSESPCANRSSSRGVALNLCCYCLVRHFGTMDVRLQPTIWNPCVPSPRCNGEKDK